MAETGIKRLTKKDIVQAVRIAARDTASSVNYNPLQVEALMIAATVLETAQWRMPRRSKWATTDC